MVYNISTDRESATDDAPDLLIKEMTTKFARLGGYFFLFSASDMIVYTRPMSSTTNAANISRS